MAQNMVRPVIMGTIYKQPSTVEEADTLSTQFFLPFPNESQGKTWNQFYRRKRNNNKSKGNLAQNPGQTAGQTALSLPARRIGQFGGGGETTTTQRTTLPPLRAHRGSRFKRSLSKVSIGFLSHEVIKLLD